MGQRGDCVQPVNGRERFNRFTCGFALQFGGYLLGWWLSEKILDQRYPAPKWGASWDAPESTTVLDASPAADERCTASTFLANEVRRCDRPVHDGREHWNWPEGWAGRIYFYSGDR